jgi:NADPH:quinone reductase-like Zn-dependent oxidoreductase
MKAITLKENGSSDNLVIKEVPIPTLQPHEVLVKTRALSINPVDGFVRQHEQAMQHILQPKPGEDIIIGWDIAGTVVELGARVTGFQKGDEVFGMVNFMGHGKAYAKYVAASEDHLALKPSNISPEEAAAATLAALTACQALVTYANVKKGDRVLIHAAAGGVGHYAVQLAKHFGAYVIGTGSAANEAFVRSLGADEYIDYTREQFEDRVNNADIVIDSQFGDHVLRSLDTVKEGGIAISLITYFEGAIAEKAREKKVRTHRLSVVSSGEDMKQIAALLEKGMLHSYISTRYHFEDIPAAHDNIAAGKTRGKMVIQMN